MQNAAVIEKHGFRQLIKIRPYMFYMLAQMISRFGDSVDSIAYSWMVYTLTGSELLMGSLFAFNFLPGLIFSLFTGALVDRWPKKAVLILTYAGRGLFVSLTALLYAIGQLQVWHLFVITFLNSTLECFSRPAEMSLVPRLLPKDKLLAGNSFSSSLSRTSELIGLSAAGALIALIGIAGTIAVDAATFILSAAVIGFMRNPEEAGRTGKRDDFKEKPDLIRKKNVFGDMLEAMAFIRKHPLLFTTVLFSAFINFCLTPINVLQPVYVKESLGAGAGGMSILGSALLIGMIAGGLWLGNYGGRFRKSTLILSGTLLLGAGYGSLYLPAMLPGLQMETAGLCMAVIGFAVSLSGTPLSTYVMEVTPKEMLGRIGSLVAVLCTAAMPLGSFITGWVAKYSTPQILYLWMGLLIVLPVAFLFRKKSFRAV